MAEERQPLTVGEPQGAYPKIRLKGGELLKFLMASQGHTVESVHLGTGISEGALEGILAGVHAPSVAHFLILMRFFKVKDVTRSFPPEAFL